jgi:hypothetical protein
MIDRIEDAAVLLLVTAGSLAAVTLAVWWVWVWLGDDPLGFDGMFKGE